MSNGVTASTNAATAAANKGASWSKLPSFTTPRDLTLGGRSTKKVFTPNLVVKRNKNLNVKTSKDTTAKRGGGAGRGGRGGNNRGGAGGARGGKTSTLIQTKGVFSEGAGDFNIRKAASSGRYGGGGDGGGGGGGSSSALLRPVLNKDNLKKVDIKADEKKLFEITGDSDEEECFDDYKTDAGDEDFPIRLNGAERKAKLMKLNTCKKESLDIKSECGTVEDDVAKAIATAQKLQKLHVQEMLQAQIETEAHKVLPRYPKSVNGFLELSDSPLFLLQLPDILPCENDNGSKGFFSKKETKPSPMELEIPTTSSVGTARLHIRSDYDWRTMQEGQIGKIIRYKSGKTKLQLGKTFFDLNVAMEPGFIQDCISIRTKDEYKQDSGGIINLGPINAKITATPHWEEFMSHLEKEAESEEA